MVLVSILFLQSCGVLIYRDRDLKEYQTHKEQYQPYKVKNTIKGYREFIAKYPENMFVRDAKLAIENLELAPYEKINSVEAYMEFKIRYPDNRHVSMTNVKIEQVELKRYEKMDTIEGYREFLLKYPKSNFAVLARERLQELEYRKIAEQLLENYSFDLLKYRLSLKRLKKKLQKGNSPEFGKFTHQVSTKHYKGKDYFHTSLIYPTDLTGSDSPEEKNEKFFKTVIKELLYHLNQNFTRMNKIDGFSFSITNSPEQILDTVDLKESLMEFYYPSQVVKNLVLQKISDQECLEQTIVVFKDKLQVEEEVASLSLPAESKKIFDIKNIPEERRGYEIMARVCEAQLPCDGIGTFITRMIDKNGKEKKMKVLRKWKQYYNERGIDQKFTIKILEHNKKEVEGMKILVWYYTKEDKPSTVWVYLPFMRRIVRGGGVKRSRGAPGNDFEPEDYGLRNLDKDTHRFLKEDFIENKKCYVVESIPKEKEYLYNKKIVWIEIERWLPIKTDFYDRKGELLKTLKIDWQQAYGFWNWKRAEMLNVQKDRKTIIEINDTRVNVGLVNKIFTHSWLERTSY